MQIEYNAQEEWYRNIAKENRHFEQKSALYKQIAAEKEDLQKDTIMLKARHTTTFLNIQQVAEDIQQIAEQVREETKLLRSQHATASEQQTTTDKNQFHQQTAFAQEKMVATIDHYDASPHRHIAS